MQQTKGQYRVGITFNPSQLGIVDQIKVKAAELIDLIEGIRDISLDDDLTAAQVQHANEVNRLKALAQTHVEDAAMWAVKAATKQQRT